MGGFKQESGDGRRALVLENIAGGSLLPLCLKR